MEDVRLQDAQHQKRRLEKAAAKPAAPKLLHPTASIIFTSGIMILPNMRRSLLNQVQMIQRLFHTLEGESVMPLQNYQYDTIMREYSRRQAQ